MRSCIEIPTIHEQIYLKTPHKPNNMKLFTRCTHTNPEYRNTS